MSNLALTPISDGKGSAKAGRGRPRQDPNAGVTLTLPKDDPSTSAMWGAAEAETHQTLADGA